MESSVEIFVTTSMADSLPPVAVAYRISISDPYELDLGFQVLNTAMRFSGTFLAVVGAMLVGATMANHPSPSPDGPSPSGPGPEISSLEERSSSSGPGPSPAHPLSGPAGPKVIASGPASGPFSPASDHTLVEVRSDTSSPFSPSPAGHGPKIFAPGPSPDDEHPLEVRSDDSSPSPNGPGPEGPHPHPHPHSHPHPSAGPGPGPDHTLEVRSDASSPSPNGPGPEGPHPDPSAGSGQIRTSSEFDPKEVYISEVYRALNDVQDLRQMEHDILAESSHKEDKAKLEAWNALTQEERDSRDVAAAKERVAAHVAAQGKMADERIAVLHKEVKDNDAARAKKQAELDQLVVEMKADMKAQAARAKKPSGPPDLDDESIKKLAQDKAEAENRQKEELTKEKELAEKLAADKAAADKEKQEAGAKLRLENEEAKKAEQAAANKLSEEKAAAKIEKEKADQELAKQKAEEVDPLKLAEDKEAARIEKEKVDQKLAEEKKVAEEEKKAAEAELAKQKKETKEEEEAAAAKLKEEEKAIKKQEKEAADKEKQAEKLKNIISNKADTKTERIAKPTSCSCFEVFSHVLGYETKTSGPLDKFRLDFWAVKNRKCIQYCTHPFSKLELDNYVASVKGNVNLPKNFPDHLYLEGGSESSGAHEKREEAGSGPTAGTPTLNDRLESIKSDIKDLQTAQNASPATAASEQSESSAKSDDGEKSANFKKGEKMMAYKVFQEEQKARAYHDFIDPQAPAKPQPNVAVKPAVKPISKAEPEAVYQPAVQSEPEVKPNVVYQSVPKAEPKPKVVVMSQPKAEPKPKVVVVSEPKIASKPKVVSKPVTDPQAASAELHAAYNLWLVEFKHSIKNQRAALQGDRKAIKQLNRQFTATLEEAEKNFVKANEEAAAAVAVDMRDEAFKEFKKTNDKSEAETRKMFTKMKQFANRVKADKAAMAGKTSADLDSVKQKAPIHLDDMNTVIPPKA
ncbi:hypothetical protein Q7P36_004289 [Cladosporium allicinum]